MLDVCRPSSEDNFSQNGKGRVYVDPSELSRRMCLFS